MPIANCFLHPKVTMPPDASAMVKAWSNACDLEEKDVTMNLIPVAQQAGCPYTIMVQLCLPTLWSSHDVENIMLGLQRVLCSQMHVEATEVFMMVSMVQSGHVVENGGIVRW